jgi:hypothetical protein
MAGLVPAISLRMAGVPKMIGMAGTKPGHDEAEGLIGGFNGD